MATAFTKLPFDHLVFTGSTQVGKIVMRAAADNLTPVTLELGGKSPAIVHPEFPIEEAAKRIAFGKSLNAGQVCVSPDYMMIPRDKVDAFVEAFIAAFSERYPTLRDNADYTSIITERQRDRLLDNVKDAREKGATIHEVNPASESFEGTRKLPMHIVTGVTDDMRVMQEEIFGPILPIVAYDSLEEAIEFVNLRDRPLALYYFDWNQSRADKVIRQTHSGGVCINEAMTHVMVDDMPFGGVGPSGMGHYHGKEGFLNFSKAKGIVRKGRLDANQFIGAPWGNKAYNLLLKFQLSRLSCPPSFRRSDSRNLLLLSLPLCGELREIFLQFPSALLLRVIGQFHAKAPYYLCLASSLSLFPAAKASGVFRCEFRPETCRFSDGFWAKTAFDCDRWFPL